MSTGRLAAGQTVLVQGTGGVSLFALQFARLGGARVIVTSSRDGKLERASALGASDLINYRTRPDWDAAALELTDGLGVDHVIEIGGAGTFARSLACTRPGGRISVIGFRSWYADVNPGAILRRMLTVQGIYVGSREMFEAMNRAIALHRIAPVIDRVFPLPDAVAAYRYFSTQAHVGKVRIRA